MSSTNIPPSIDNSAESSLSQEENKESQSTPVTPSSSKSERLEKLSAVFLDFFVERKKQEDPTPAFICDGLYLGSVGSARNREELDRLGITHILCVAGAIRPYFPDDFTYKTIAVEDSSNVKISSYFEESFEYIDNCISNGGKVLVHCFAGKSRSVTITCAYLIRKDQMAMGEALRLIKSRRKVANPNPGFLIQLLRYQTRLGIRTERGKNFGKRRRSEPVVSPSIQIFAKKIIRGVPSPEDKLGMSVPPVFIISDDLDSDSENDDDNDSKVPATTTKKRGSRGPPTIPRSSTDIHLSPALLDEDNKHPMPGDEYMDLSPPASPFVKKLALNVFAVDSETARKSRQILHDELIDLDIDGIDENEDVDDDDDERRPPPPIVQIPHSLLANAEELGSSISSHSMGSSTRSIVDHVQLSPAVSAASHTSRNSASSLVPIDESDYEDFDDEERTAFGSGNEGSSKTLLGISGSDLGSRTTIHSDVSDQFLSTPR